MIMKNFKKLLYSQWFVLVIIIILISTVTALVNPKFLTWKNLLAIVTQVASLSLCCNRRNDHDSLRSF